VLGGSRRAQQPTDGVASGLVLAAGQEEADQPPTGRPAVAAELVDLSRLERGTHRGYEQLLLGAEVVVHEGGVHLGPAGDGTDAGTVVAVLAERPPSRLQDRLPGPAVTPRRPVRAITSRPLSSG
jgi:hypothetical protein